MTDPVSPALYGTSQLFADGTTYTAGREPANVMIRILLRNGDGRLACDIETAGLEGLARDIKSVSYGVAKAAVVLDPRDPFQAATIRWTFDNATELIFHNSAFDVPNLCIARLMEVQHIAKVVDTLIYARLAEPDERTSKSLEAAGRRWLEPHSSKDNALTIEQAFRVLGLSRSEGYRRMDIDTPLYLKRAAADPIVTYRLLPLVRQAAMNRLTTGHPFSDNGVTGDEALELRDREQTVNRIMLRRSARGLRVDLEFLDRYRAGHAAEVSAAEAELRAEGIEPGNGNQLTTWLEANGALPADHPRTQKTRRPSASADHLERIAHPLARTFVRHKQIVKVDRDYLDKVVDLAVTSRGHERVHPSVNILGASATGRMSYGSPPFQQFPPGARGVVLADENDALTSIDWSQIEPVTAANIAGDRAVLAGYEDGSSDLYTAVAELAGVPRKTAKVIVLAQMYGEGIRKLAADLKISMDEAEQLKRAVFGAMPKVANLIYRLKRIGEDHKTIFTLSGRILTVPSGVKNGFPWVATHKAVNYFVQGSAYDILAEALVRVEAAGLGDAVYLALHDELVVSSSAAHDVRKIMEEPPERLCRLAKRIPVLRTDLAEMGERWAAA